LKEIFVIKNEKGKKQYEKQGNSPLYFHKILKKTEKDGTSTSGQFLPSLLEA